MLTGACQSEAPATAGDGGEQARLQALLHDAPLGHVPPATDTSARGAPADDIATPEQNDVVLGSVRPLGVWNFDDCTTSRTNLSDGSGNNNTAFRSVGTTCVDGIQSSHAVALAAAEDIIYVPDQPSFAFENGVTVAGWFRPTVVGGTRTLFRKRDKGTSSFALLLEAGKFEFVVNLGNDVAISVMSPARATPGAYQHVAASYDGATARLYVNGVEVNHFDVAGSIPPGPGPLVMGNDGSERRFSGAIDSALFATHALTADEVLALTCLPAAPTMVVTPDSPTAVAGEAALIDAAITNHNPAACAPLTFSLVMSTAASDLTIGVPPPFVVHSPPVPSGATGHIVVTATPRETLEAGRALSFGLTVSEPVTGFSQSATVQLRVIAPTGCHVANQRELIIKSITVVDDPVRTAFDPSSTDPRNGVWSFKHLMESIARTPADAPAMVEAMLGTFTTAQTINGFAIASRPGMQSTILARWPRTSDGALDLAQAPLRLQAIVNRFDLRNLNAGDAGEGRFVFAFIDPTNPPAPPPATMLLEYKLPAASESDVLDWAQSFHALGAIAFGEAYNQALQNITERFAGRNASPDRTNGSAISAVRTNEIAFSTIDPWQMRSFALSATSGRLEPAPLALTPDRSFNNTAALASYINANQAAIIAETHTVPAQFNGQPFQAGAVFNRLDTWFAPGVDPETRFHFAVNTCNGCHSLSETGAVFAQIFPRAPFTESGLSAFLIGRTVGDPVTGQARTFNDLGRRNADLKAVVCADSQAISPAVLRKGIQRVH